MSVVNIISQSAIKPLVVGSLCFVGDKYILQEPYFERSAIFGAVCGGSVFFASTAGQLIQPYLPQNFMTSELAQTIEGRLIEVSLGAISYGIVSKFVLNTEFNKDEMMKKLAILAVSDVVGEFVAKMIVNAV